MNCAAFTRSSRPAVSAARRNGWIFRNRRSARPSPISNTGWAPSLLHRGSPPQPTEAGIRLLRFAETVLNEERETLADISQIKSGALSTLSLALSPAANSRVGVALLKEFCERNPHTRLKVVVAPSREIVHGVGEGRWELGFGPFHHNMPAHFALHPCFSETRRLMISRDHPARAALARDAAAHHAGIAAAHLVSRRDHAPFERRTAARCLRLGVGGQPYGIATGPGGRRQGRHLRVGLADRVPRNWFRSRDCPTRISIARSGRTA